MKKMSSKSQGRSAKTSPVVVNPRPAPAPASGPRPVNRKMQQKSKR